MKPVLRRDFENKSDAIALFFELASDYRMNASFSNRFADARTGDDEYMLQYVESRNKFVVRLLKRVD